MLWIHGTQQDITPYRERIKAMGNTENAWDAHCDCHDARNEQLLLAKLTAMQAAGDALAEVLAGALAAGLKKESQDDPTVRKVQSVLTAWEQAKEQTK